MGFILGFKIFKDILLRYFSERSVKDAKEKALKIADRLTIYVVIATIFGAKFGHYLFYEQPSSYLNHPMEFLLSREGLASHGAALGIILALWAFSYHSQKIEKGLGWICLMDFISVPTALAAVFIRLGNFMNQEILGTPTDLPWGVLFGHPADGSAPIPRHPVQLYEAIFYFLVFLLLWRWSYRPPVLLAKGKLIGWFLFLVFGFRFIVEFFKLEQSQLLSLTAAFTMGQWLSLPFILLGVILIFLARTKSSD